VAPHELDDLLVGDAARAERVDRDRDRLGDADGVGELELDFVGHAGGDEVLRDVARHVAGRAVDLRGIFPREGAAAVTAAAAVGVDDDLAARQAGVALRSADDEPTRRVDVEDGVVVDQRGRERPA
jgi:hypothetical protein